MATATVSTPPTFETVADLVERLGGIPLERIRMQPSPGTATEADVVAALEAPRKRICELIDGVLVEKPMGFEESILAGIILHWLWSYLDEHDLGVAAGADGMLRFRIGLVRIPDVSFISWDRIPGGELPGTAIPAVIPDLAVEVLSRSNTKKEMEVKLADYFTAGVRLVWLLDPKSQTAEEYTSTTKKRKINKDQALDGGTVLPSFRLPLKELFARAKRKRKS